MGHEVITWETFHWVGAYYFSGANNWLQAGIVLPLIPVLGGALVLKHKLKQH